MSKESREFFEQLKAGQQPSLVESIREAASSLKEVGGKIWDSLTPAFEHGAHELASAMFRGDGYVMYPRNGQANGQQQESQEVQQQEKSRGGREL
jgi:hypothetical protein